MNAHHAIAVRSATCAPLRLRNGVPTINSLTIAREFGRHHKHVLRTLDSLIADGTINRPNFEPVDYVDAKGEKRRMIDLDERGALIAMPFIGGRRSRAGQVRLVDAFLALRGTRGDNATRPRKPKGRQAVHAAVLAALIASRCEAGSRIEPHHLDGDAALIVAVLTNDGHAIAQHAADRDEAHFVFRMRAHDLTLTMVGTTRERRVAGLVAYSNELRAAHSLAGRLQ